LFLDELPEFSRATLEVLREPMEAGKVTISRANHKITFPARFQLIAAMNPCLCGFDGDPERSCRCTQSQIQRYRQRISGPLLDRLDLTVAMTRVPASTLLSTTVKVEGSSAVRARVVRASDRQTSRQGCANGHLVGKALKQVCSLREEERQLLASAMDTLKLSARAMDRTLKVARTIADLAGEVSLSNAHISEALSYRNPEFKQ
jgi:magnesium chelatase family protein